MARVRFVAGVLATIVAGTLGGWADVADAAGGPPHPSPIASRAAIPLGAAVFYGCTDPSFSGPAPLACQVKPTAPATAAGLASRYADAVSRFDRITPENELKMVWTQPQQGRFDFATADKLAAFAQARDMRMRGHTLVYAASSPRWLTHPQKPWSRDTLLATMTNQITTEVSHFRDAFPGVVDQWDVVNEPFLDGGRRDPNVFQTAIGDDWIEQAFRTAHAADPDALLFLNEFNADTPGPRQQAVLALVEDFLARGVPIDGVGLQMHIGDNSTYPTVEAIGGVMAQYAALGLRVAVTELDALRPAPDDGGAAQRTAYNTVAEACRRATNCVSTTVWGVADPYSWRGAEQHADLIDAGFTAKAAYADVRCRLDDPRPLAAAWTPKPCGGALFTATPAAPAAPSTSPAPSEPAPADSSVLPSRTVAPPAGPKGPSAQPVAAGPAPPHPPISSRLVSPHLRLLSARRTARTVRVTGTTAAAAQGTIRVSFRQDVRGRALATSADVAVRQGRFSAVLRLGDRLARVRSGVLSARYSGSAEVRPASVSRTLRWPH